MKTLRALVLLTATLATRLIRQGIVIRSLAFPIGLTLGTLVLTLVVVSYLHGPQQVAIGPQVDAGLLAALASEEWVPVRSPDPAALVRSGDAFGGTDGKEVWTYGDSRRQRILEGHVRRSVGAPWNHAPVPLLPATVNPEQRDDLVTLMALLFGLYGVVFGAGMVARDRDDGTLEAELALPVAHWVHGASRWLAGSAVLALFFTLSVTLLDAFLHVPDAGASIRHGIAATACSVGVGLSVIGRGGLKQGFSGPLAFGLSFVTGLIASGYALPAEVTRYVPLASLSSGGSGWEALISSLGLGLIAVALFSRFAARG